jgi:hypothetical protein
MPLLTIKFKPMKKIILMLPVLAFLSFGLSSCKKCGECSDQAGLFYQGEYCKGNAIEDALYNAAKAECEANGGKFN